MAKALAVATREGMGVVLLPIHSALNGLRIGQLVWVMPESTSQNMNL
ncbi:UNVERIFIED_ORG: DNA-binding transcriptional LysR family regulator [Paraburkholderia sediminicola]|nr:DNA-binding transcriptional LysR family regulator [Paraburkholderia sediminicola]